MIAAQGTTTRPTSDRVREALFSRLQSRYGLEGARILDVFAGTGALAIEALSRGARSALCIEHEKAALAALRRNVAALGLGNSLEIAARDFRSALAVQAGKRATFDGVFLDPPYEQGLAEEALGLLDADSLVALDGWVVAETATREKLPSRVGSLLLQREDEYGHTRLLLYERQGADTEPEENP